MDMQMSIYIIMLHCAILKRCWFVCWPYIFSLCAIHYPSIWGVHIIKILNDFVLFVNSKSFWREKSYILRTLITKLHSLFLLLKKALANVVERNVWNTMIHQSCQILKGFSHQTLGGGRQPPTSRDLDQPSLPDTCAHAALGYSLLLPITLQCLL